MFYLSHNLENNAILLPLEILSQNSPSGASNVIRVTCSRQLLSVKLALCVRGMLLPRLPVGSSLPAAAAAAAKSLQSCLTLCDPIDGSPLGSSVLGILQARILEWVAITFSSLPRIGYFLLVCELLVISGSGFFSLVPHLGKNQH